MRGCVTLKSKTASCGAERGTKFKYVRIQGREEAELFEDIGFSRTLTVVQCDASLLASGMGSTYQWQIPPEAVT